jgi:hypothetical protein
MMVTKQSPRHPGAAATLPFADHGTPPLGIFCRFRYSRNARKTPATVVVVAHTLP